LFNQIITNQATVNTTSSALALQPLTTYYWQVIGRNSAGQEFGEFSETWSFTTDSGFKAPVLINPANNSVSLSYGKNYWWRVRSSVSGNSGPWSEIWTFRLQDPNGLETLEASSIVYPNPSSGFLRIQHSIGLKELSMMNAVGQTIPVRLQEEGEGLVVFYEAVPSGIYWLSWTDEAGIHREKISVLNSEQ